MLHIVVGLTLVYRLWTVYKLTDNSVWRVLDRMALD